MSSTILPQHVHSLNIEIEAPMKSIIEILKSPNAVLGVLALALLAQMPHAANQQKAISQIANKRG